MEMEKEFTNEVHIFVSSETGNGEPVYINL